MKSFLMQFKLITASILQTTYKRSLGLNKVTLLDMCSSKDKT